MCVCVCFRKNKEKRCYKKNKDKEKNVIKKLKT